MGKGKSGAGAKDRHREMQEEEMAQLGLAME